MAPSRKKSANKASAAAARKWNFGDLVLAKVKGFPAWPATVSEPQKWGFPSDLKKRVLVYFFGTQQIAVCNSVDVEEFTEEKKVSLLGKRHGKGSDFVRALNEIIDCFEKLKNQDQVASDNLTEETNITNENNSEESLTRSINDEAAVVAVERICSGPTDNLNSLTEAAVAAAAEDALHDEVKLEEAHSNSGLEMRVYSTRSKTDAAQSRKIGSHRRISARRLRRSSRVDCGRLQNLLLPSTNNHRSSRWLASNVQDKSLRSSRRPSDDSEGYNSPFVSNDSMDDNDSEIMTVDSDPDGLNNGSSVDSGCKSIGEEPFTENNEREAELSDRFDFQGNATIIKKKRKPNRKRLRSDLVAKLDEVVSETEVLNIVSVAPINNEKVAEKCHKEDGDEHLPLVKRARVRMGRLLPAGDEEGSLACEEENMMKIPESSPTHSCRPLISEVDSPTDIESDHTKGNPGTSSLLHASPARKPQYWGTRNNFADGEAALPPSKRLHRALEAMSANAAEHSQRASSSPMEDTHAERCSSSSEKCPKLSIEKTTLIESRTGQEDDHSSDAFEDCPGLNMEVLENVENTTKVVLDCGKTCSDVDSSCPELCKDTLEYAEGYKSKCLKSSPLIAENQHVNPDSSNNGVDLFHLDSDRPCLIVSPDGCKAKPAELEAAAKRSEHDVSPINSDAILVEEIVGDSLNIENCIHTDSKVGGGDEPQMKKQLSLSKNQDSQRSEFLGDAIPECTMRLSNSGRHGYLSRSNTVSDGRLKDRAVSVTQSSSVLESVANASPPSSSMCNISSSDGYVEKSSSCNNGQLHLGKARFFGRSNSKVELLSSFEAIVRSLTRTKDCIGRATRIAIDCAKCGHATKVVESLACNLESESSPHKKVDLFFLVDSIAQCSGGMKGDAGVYPSVILALLPRLLLAAAPPPTSFNENRRQCLKVLRVWLERKILPETIIRHHIRELDAIYGLHVPRGSRRSCRFERPFDDPIREMEGMLVDEYGSNSSIQLPGFCMPPMRTDDDIGSDSDGESFEAVTPEHHVDNLGGETAVIVKAEKRSHILEDVDGELEMEDVAPRFDTEITPSSIITGTDCKQMSHHQHYGAPFDAHQPDDTQLISAHLSRSPLLPPLPSAAAAPPPPHPLPPSVFPSEDSSGKQSLSPRIKPRTYDAVHHHCHENKDSEAQLPRQISHCSNACPSGENPTSHLSGRASNGFHPVDDAFSKGFHLYPPNPAQSNQFLYVSERNHSRRDITHHSHPSRFHTRNAENGNFYRDRDRNKFGQRDNIGEQWRPPLPSISGSYHQDGSRMAHTPMSYSGPPREPALPNNRWIPPRSMNHRQFNHYRPPYDGPIPVTNRGPNFWKGR